MLNEKIVRFATLQIKINKNLEHFKNDTDSRISRLDDANDTTVERLNILERYFKFMLGGLVFMFVVLLVAFVLVIVLNTK